MASERSQQSGSIDILASALDQTAEVLGNVRDDQLEAPTPCDDWTVGRLVDHIVATPDNFAAMMRGEQPDFSTAAPQVGADRKERFCAGGDTLLALWCEQVDEAQGNADWPLAELAVHTWDLATATGQPTDRLDPEVARRGLDFMQEHLSADKRGKAFGPAQPAPDEADAYRQIAAFAGRSI
jgi:uncharacterized protein (TIGR03086 family)